MSQSPAARMPMPGYETRKRRQRRSSRARLGPSRFASETKKPTWRNTRRYSTTSAYSTTSPPARPGCSPSSHPTTSLESREQVRCDPPNALNCTPLMGECNRTASFRRNYWRVCGNRSHRPGYRDTRQSCPQPAIEPAEKQVGQTYWTQGSVAPLGPIRRSRLTASFAYIPLATPVHRHRMN